MNVQEEEEEEERGEKGWFAGRQKQCIICHHVINILPHTISFTVLRTRNAADNSGHEV
jgi:hypothetical protein